MKAFLQILIVGYELGLLPFAVGSMLTFLWKKQIGPFSYLLGYFVVFAVFWLVAVPLLCLHQPLTVITLVWRLILTAMVGVLIAFFCASWDGLWKWYGRFAERVRHWDVMHSFFIVVCVVVTLFAAVWVMPSAEDDTAETAAIMDAADEAYVYEPYTLNPVEHYPNEDVFSPLEVFYVVNARLADIPTTQFIHVLLPFFLLPLLYAAYWQMGEFFWRGCAEKKELFVLLVILFYAVASYSTKTLALCALQNIWNGTTLAAACVFPAVLTAGLSLPDAFSGGGKKAAGEIGFLLLCYVAGQLLLPEAFLITTAVLMCCAAARITERCLKHDKCN